MNRDLLQKQWQDPTRGQQVICAGALGQKPALVDHGESMPNRSGERSRTGIRGTGVSARERKTRKSIALTCRLTEKLRPRQRLQQQRGKQSEMRQEMPKKAVRDASGTLREWECC